MLNGIDCQTFGAAVRKAQHEPKESCNVEHERARQRLSARIPWVYYTEGVGET